MSSINITLSDKKTCEMEAGTSIADLIHAHFPADRPHIAAAKINGNLVDLDYVLDCDIKIDFIKTDSPEGLHIFWHSSSHIMAQAVQNLYPDAQLGIGPSIQHGFYYDFKLDTPITPDDLPRIEAEIDKIVSEKQRFKHNTVTKDEAIALFQIKNEPFKVELLQEIEDEEVNIYQNGPFMDLCRGPHIPSTEQVKNIKLLSVAGSYWHGDERNPVMQRIYGISYPDKKQLKAYLLKIEEAKKRDHRKLGRELNLFSFHDEGPGFPFWHPNGMILNNSVQSYMSQTLSDHGYSEIRTPVILNESLWHRSGHWDNYKENMYFTSIDDQPYAVKPMNCPGGLLVYKDGLHSYRELPIKLSEMGLVHRHEKSGVLHGLFRVRMFTQDDAHVFCMPEQLEDEVIAIIDLIDEVYKTFGFENYQVELSTRPSKSIGSAEMWTRAESALENALKRKNMNYQLNPGDGAFYGPKIDYHIQDSLERTWQCGTIQVDFSMPERFQLEYVGADNQRHQPVMIHRAILGSVERFIGILIEHYGGDFPLWMAPVQCILIPVSERHTAYAKELHQTMIRAGLRCDIDERNEKIGAKIRDAENRKINYMCIVGDQEIENKSISVRKRKKGNEGEVQVDALIDKLVEQIRRRIYH